MNAEIISIGTELLLGHIINTNTVYLSKKLAEVGIDVYHQTTVGDNMPRLTAAIKQALVRSDIVITSGGLGPTVDDITIETIGRLAGKKNIKFMNNDVGSAPGLIVKDHEKVIICLPGPPRELEPMFEKTCMPYFEKLSEKKWVIRSRTIKMTGLAESQVDSKVRDLLNLKPPTTVGIYAKLGQVELKIMAKAKDAKSAARAISKLERKIRGRLKDYIFGCDDETLEETVGRSLIKKKLTLAVAESCTGGLVSNRISNISGSSAYFAGGVVAYSNSLKENILGVSKASLKRDGAVSETVALEMAAGIKLLACANIGIGITGIAGPTGGTRKKPVGLVYIALAARKKRIVKELHLNGSREDIKWQASQVALDILRKNT